TCTTGFSPQHKLPEDLQFFHPEELAKRKVDKDTGADQPGGSEKDQPKAADIKEGEEIPPRLLEKADYYPHANRRKQGKDQGTQERASPDAPDFPPKQQQGGDHINDPC